MRWTARALSLALSLGLGFALAEGSLRWLESRSLPPSPRTLPADTMGLPAIQSVPALATPNQRANYRGALYRTNSRGFRGPEFAIQKPQDVFRIAMIGDSYTMGSGVRYEEAYPARTEMALRESVPEKRVQVLNFGLAGLTLAAEVEHRLPVAMEYQPDLLVYGFTVNDLEGPDYRAQPLLPPIRNPSRVLTLLWERWRWLREIFWPEPGSYIYELDQNFFENPQAWRDFVGELDKLAALSRTRRMCVVVFLHPQIGTLNHWHPFQRHYDAVEVAAKQRGLHVVPGLPSLMGQDEAALRCGPFDWHPNAEGHRLLAEGLTKGILGLPPECWQGTSSDMHPSGVPAKRD